MTPFVQSTIYNRIYYSCKHNIRKRQGYACYVADFRIFINMGYIYLCVKLLKKYFWICTMVILRYSLRNHVMLLLFMFSNVVYIKVPFYYLHLFQFNSAYNIYFSITVLWSSEKNSFIYSHIKSQSHQIEIRLFSPHLLPFIYTYTFTQTYRTESIHPPLCVFFLFCSLHLQILTLFSLPSIGQ